MSGRIPSPSLEGAPRTTPRGRRVNVSAYPAHPILKKAPWTWLIPAYFLFGGMAGVAGAIAGVADLTGRRRLANRARTAALIALVPCPPLLILDLGRPERFLNMLRVFRPTSPMNVGTWLLTAFGGALSGSAFSAVTGFARPLGRLASLAALLLGPAVATYTGVLLSNTSAPAWHGARRWLPALFAASAASSGGAAVCLLTPPALGAPARRVAIAGATAEIALARSMEARLGEAGSVYAEGPASGYVKASAALSAGGAATLALFGRRRSGAVAGSLMLLGGACLLRFAVWKAGERSAELT